LRTKWLFLCACQELTARKEELAAITARCSELDAGAGAAVLPFCRSLKSP
jgi:hypothetical protein